MTAAAEAIGWPCDDDSPAESEAPTDRVARPYADHADDAAERGYDPLPLPPNAKTPPPAGFTGANGASPSAAQIAAWCASRGDGNMALRLPRNVVGVDVDHYGPKRGADTLAALVAELGALPPTWRITSRGTDSKAGILPYRLPAPVTLADSFGPSIDAIQFHHRYAVAPGSIHPEGRRYECFDAYGEGSPLPFVDELPELPPEWVERFTVSHRPAQAAATSETVERFAADHSAFAMGEARGRKLLDAAVATVDEGNRHGSTLRALCWAAREAAAGVYPWAEAIAAIRERFAALVGPKRARSGEYEALVAFAIGQVSDDDVAAVRERLGDAPADETTGPQLARLAIGEDFWREHPALGTVRDAAWSRGRSPAAVLGCVLTRVCAELDAMYALPPIVGGGAGSLNLAAAIVSPSGMGKSTADAVAGDLLVFAGSEHGAADPRPLDLPLGSGEGVAEAYMVSRPATEDEKAAGLAVQGRIREQGQFRLRFVGDEGEAVMAQKGRNGSTLMPTLRTMLTGGTLGQQNAAADNRRIIPAHRYRASLLLGFQVATAEALVDDAAGGTPQRFLFCTGQDATIPAPDERPSWPGELVVRMPTPQWRDALARIAGDRRAVPVAECVAREVVLADWQRQTGASEYDTLDSHRNLTRLKVAALLGLITSELSVTAETWRLAGTVLDHSRAVLDLVLAHKAANERDTAQRRTRAAVAERLATEDAAERRALDSAVRSAAKVLRRHAVERAHDGRGCPRRCVNRAMASRHRQLVTSEDVTAELLTRELAERDGEHLRPGRKA